MEHERSLTLEQQQLIVDTLFASSFVGCIGSLFIIITFIAFKDARSFGTSLVFFLSCADLLAGVSTSKAWTYVDESAFGCTVQGMLVQFSYISSVMWSFYIVLTVYVVLYQDTVDVIRKRWKWYFSAAWAYPFIGCIVPLITGEYQRFFPELPHAWCWLPDSTAKARLLLYIPDIVCLISMIVLLGCVLYKQFFVNRYLDPATKMIIRNMGLYIMVYLITQSLAIVNRIQNFADPGRPIFALYFMQSTLQPLTGFFDALVYGLTEPLFLDQYRRWCRCCRCCWRFKSSGEYKALPINDDEEIKYGTRNSSSRSLREHINYESDDVEDPDLLSTSFVDPSNHTSIGI